MKLATFTAVAILFGAGYAFAGAGAPVPEGSQSGIFRSSERGVG
jgi:hypothetical protein